MYDTILYPTDGSEGAEGALEHAKTIANQFDATIHVLFVADSGFGDTQMRVKKEDGKWTTGMMRKKQREGSKTKMSKNDIDINDILEREGKEFTKQIATDLEEAGIKASPACRRGAAAQTIMDYAENNGADVIVMGTHGRSGINRRVIGSVTEKVVRGSNVPVLSVHLDK